jgi:hypothetical protein
LNATGEPLGDRSDLLHEGGRLHASVFRLFGDDPRSYHAALLHPCSGNRFGPPLRLTRKGSFSYITGFPVHGWSRSDRLEAFNEAGPAPAGGRCR